MFGTILSSRLKTDLETVKGQKMGYQYAKIYAVVLDKLGREEEAIAVIEEQLKFASVEEEGFKDQFLLLLGLIGEKSSNRGKLALRELLNREADRELQKIALHLFARRTGSAEEKQEFKELVDELIALPQSHALLDELYFFRGQLALEDGHLDETEAYANELLSKFPGSRLKNRAILHLAYLSWKRKPPQYRTAADYLNRLRMEFPEGMERARLTVLMADCYYLNQDYKSAADAYNTAINEQGSVLPQGPLVFQQIMSEIQAGLLEEASKHLDKAHAFGKADALNRWRAEWNLINKMKEEKQIEGAFQRIRGLLSRPEATKVPPELQLRLMWLEAQLSMEARQFIETPHRTDSILATLAEIPEDTIPIEQRDQIISHTLLIKGEALFEINEIEKALKIFEQLRSRYPESEPAVLSHLIEARYYAQINQTVDAQQRFIALADQYPESKYAPVALYEAAVSAEQRGLNTTYNEAVALLERLINTYSKHSLVYYARLKQADLSRKLNDFPTARLIYEDLINQFPKHPERY